jgi:hypothetical protein
MSEEDYLLMPFGAREEGVKIWGKCKRKGKKEQRKNEYFQVKGLIRYMRSRENGNEGKNGALSVSTDRRRKTPLNGGDLWFFF